MKKIISLILLHFILYIPISCRVDDCGSFDPMGSTIESLRAYTTISDDNNVLNLDVTDYRRAQIGVQIEDVRYFDLAMESGSRLSAPGISIAYACSPPEPEPQQLLTSIEISSTAAVYENGLTYEAGSSLNELFEISSQWQSSGDPVGAFIQRQNEDPFEFGYAGQEILFYLFDEPDSTISDTINIQLRFNDGAEFDLSVDDFEVLVEE